MHGTGRVKCWKGTAPLYETLCVISYHLNNLKNMKDTHEGVLLLVRLQPVTLLKVSLLHGCFSSFLICTISTKSLKASYMLMQYLLLQTMDPFRGTSLLSISSHFCFISFSDTFIFLSFISVLVSPQDFRAIGFQYYHHAINGWRWFWYGGGISMSFSFSFIVHLLFKMPNENIQTCISFLRYPH